MGSQSIVGLTRSSSRVAQAVFDLRQDLDLKRCSGTSPLLRTLAKLGHRSLRPTWDLVRKGKWVHGHVYGRDLEMPAEHPVLPTVTSFPLFNRPLGMAVTVLPHSEKLLSVIDVGANIGETVAVIEEMNPDKCIFFCIEPEHELVGLAQEQARDLALVDATAVPVQRALLLRDRPLDHGPTISAGL